MKRDCFARGSETLSSKAIDGKFICYRVPQDARCITMPPWQGRRCALPLHPSGLQQAPF